MSRLHLVLKSGEKLFSELVVVNFKMTDWFFSSEESVEQIFAVLVDCCGRVGLVLFEGLFENLVGSLSYKPLNLPQLFFLLLYKPLIFVHKTRLESLVSLIARSCLSLLYTLLPFVVLALFKRLPIYCIVVLLRSNILPLLHFFNSMDLRLWLLADAKKVDLSALRLGLV